MKTHQGIIGASVAAGLVILAGLGWHALRVEIRERERTSREILARLERSNEGLTRLGQKLGATTRTLSAVRADLVQLLDLLSARLAERPARAAATEIPESSEEEARVDEDMEDLPPLPKGLAAPSLLSSFGESGKVWDIIRNPLLNPQGKEPDSLEAVMILRELVHAKARIDMLRTDVQVRVAEARLILSDAGEYIDYAPGEGYMTARDAVTVGEKTEDGRTRMYYLYAEEFPEIHEMRAEQRSVAERALRRIAGILE